jgi:HTH-type transcriptional regulator/antitoxin HigA
MRKPSKIAVYPIRNDADLTKALSEIGPLLNSARPGSREEARLEVLSVLISDYESKHHPIAPPDPIEAIKFRLEQQGLTHKALEGVIGTRARVHEVLNKKRALTLEMIRKLNHTFGIPVDSLVGTSREHRSAGAPS